MRSSQGAGHSKAVQIYVQIGSRLAPLHPRCASDRLAGGLQMFIKLAYLVL